MNMTFELTSVFSAFAAFNCFFFSIIFLSVKAGNVRANRYGSALLTALGLTICHHAINESSDSLLKYQSFFIFPTFCLTLGPLARFLVETIVKQDICRPQKRIPHFIPFFIASILSIGILLLLPPYTVSEKYFKWIWATYQVHVFVYFIFNLKMIENFKKQLDRLSSDNLRHTLNWLDKISWCMVGLWLTWVLTEYGHSYIRLYIRSPLYCLFIYWIFYHSLKYKSIFMSSATKNAETVTENAEMITELSEIDAEEAPKPKQTDPRLMAFKEELLHFMAAQKPYLDAELSLPKLAEQMDVSVHFLSQAINTGLNENFYQFVNRYRVEESKKLLHDPDKQHFNILQIAYEAGFNSKTTFNTTFKKMTGISPSEFQKQVKCPEKA